MEEAKYVIVCNGFGECAIVFDKIISHNSFFHHNAISAGFVSFSPQENGKISVFSFGKSTSLNAKSRGAEDDYLICKALNPTNDRDCWLFIPAKREKTTMP